MQRPQTQRCEWPWRRLMPMHSREFQIGTSDERAYDQTLLIRGNEHRSQFLLSEPKDAGLEPVATFLRPRFPARFSVNPLPIERLPPWSWLRRSPPFD